MSRAPLWDQITAMLPGLPPNVLEFTLHMVVGELPTVVVECLVLDNVTDDGVVPVVTKSFRIVEDEPDDLESNEEVKS